MPKATDLDFHGWRQFPQAFCFFLFCFFFLSLWKAAVAETAAILQLHTALNKFWAALRKTESTVGIGFVSVRGTAGHAGGRDQRRFRVILGHSR